MSDEGSVQQRRVDARLERWLGLTLRVGVVVATSLLAVALILQLAGAAAALARVLAHVGLIVLMATPVARVAISVAEYANERDWTFLALTLTVLGVLVASFLLGL